MNKINIRIISALVGGLIGATISYSFLELEIKNLKDDNDELKLIYINEVTSNRLTYLKIMRSQEKSETIEDFEKILGWELQDIHSFFHLHSSEDWKKEFKQYVEAYKIEFPDHSLDKKLH